MAKLRTFFTKHQISVGQHKFCVGLHIICRMAQMKELQFLSSGKICDVCHKIRISCKHPIRSAATETHLVPVAVVRIQGPPQLVGALVDLHGGILVTVLGTIR
jgi:hypothetical protein